MKLELPERKKLVHTLHMPIRWGDMDAMGHVNNTLYFRYLEIARIDLALCDVRFVEDLKAARLGQAPISTGITRRTSWSTARSQGNSSGWRARRTTTKRPTT